MNFVIALLVIVVPLGLNVFASKTVARDDYSSKSQKVAQLLFVWLLPIIGAIFVLAVHRPQEAPARRYREQPDPGEDYGLSGGAAKGIGEALDGD